MVKLEVRKNTYFDSVTLMIISKDVKAMDGVKEALVGMGTDLNREIAANLGLDAAGFEDVTANDFFVAADVESEENFTDAVAKADELLSRKSEKSKAEYFPPTLDGAVKVEKDLNMAVISVPGKFAADVARDCLERDINVMIFSDNVTVEEEKELKEYAASRELLVMGPDCGTAIINNVPLAFANVVHSGNIGLVCASGTGAQEVSVIIDQLGGGISQLLGTGGRDLKSEIGGIMMKLCLDALIKDPQTEIIGLVSKPPAPEVEARIFEIAANAGKPVVVCFIGGNAEKIREAGLYAALSLEDAAHKLVALAKGREATDFIDFDMGRQAAEKKAAGEAGRMAEGQKYIRGLYTGGTLCDEAMKMLIADLGSIKSNIPLKPADLLENARSGKSVENTFLDFGDDEFTVGRPHPMIDPSLRAGRVVEEAKDPETAVILVDCVLGYGSHEDPAKDLSDAIRQAKAIAKESGRYIAVVASVCGTEGDPQNRTASMKQLSDAGAVVLPSNAQAARFARMILQQL